MRTTQRTETSYYLEEKKEKSITLVVASETVIAQTSLRTGVVGHQNTELQNYTIVESSGKKIQRR